MLVLKHVTQTYYRYSFKIVVIVLYCSINYCTIWWSRNNKQLR